MAIVETTFLALMVGFSAIIATQIFLYYKFKADLYNHNLELAAVISQTIENIGQQIDVEPPTPGQIMLMELFRNKMGAQESQERDLQGKFT